VNNSKLTKEQIAFALEQTETGTPVKEVVREMGIAETTFYRWRRKHGGLGTVMLRRLGQLEVEKWTTAPSSSRRRWLSGPTRTA